MTIDSKGNITTPRKKHSTKRDPVLGIPTKEFRCEEYCCEGMEKRGVHDHAPIAPSWDIPRFEKGHLIIKKKDEGRKSDDGKLRWDLLPWDAIEKIVEILTYGAKKYEPNNWQKISSERYFAAEMRHNVADLKGEVFDPESGYLHLAHAACNALFLLWQKIQDIYTKKRMDPRDIFKTGDSPKDIERQLKKGMENIDHLAVSSWE